MATETATPDQNESREDEIPEPILEISTLIPKAATVRIKTDEAPEGVLYELRQMDDFGIEDQQRLTQEGAEFDKLWNTSDLNKSGRQRMKMLLDKMFDKVLIAPPEIKAKCRDSHKTQVVLAFTLAPLAAQATQMRMAQEAREDGSTTES